jgi:hypothetical protein
MDFGILLENYKQWFLKQPKLLQVGVLPVLVGASIILLKSNIKNGYYNTYFVLAAQRLDPFFVKKMKAPGPGL